MTLAKIISSLVKDKAGVFDPSTNSFRTLDYKKASHSLNLQEEANKRGAADIPPSEAETYDDVEQKIIALVKNEQRNAKEICDSNLKVLSSRLDQLSSQAATDRFSNVTHKCAGDLASQVQKNSFFLYTSRLNVTKSEDELAAFKIKHSREVEARYPESRFNTYALIALLVMIESALNGYFFSQHNEMGWLGGISISFLLSIANISIGLFLGNFGYRLIRHKLPSLKVAGIAICIFCIALIFTVNIGIAHYRAVMSKPFELSEFTGSADESAAHAKSASVLAAESFLKNPLNITDMESWLLIMMGSIFSLFASYKAYRSDDPYFRYGEYARHRDQCIEEYGHMAANMLEDLQHVRDEHLEMLEQIHHEISNARGEINSIYGSYSNWQNLYQTHSLHLEDTGRILLAEYRNLNISVRAISAPKYFNEQWKLETLPLEKFNKDFEHVTEQINKAIEVSQKLSAKASKDIKEYYEQNRLTYKSIEDLQPTEIKPAEFETWLNKNIQKSAISLAVA